MANSGGKPYNYGGGFNSPELEYSFLSAKQKTGKNIYHKDYNK